MSAGFKEWALICEALGSGRQTIIVRKGGIAEGKAGFAFKHPEFLLFPTWFHEQLTKTRLPETTPIPVEKPDSVEIRYAATLIWSRFVSNPATIDRLRDFHVWTDEVIQERFQYDDAQGVHVALIRVYRLDPPLHLKQERRFGGCRSWLDLPEPVGSAMVSVLSDEEFASHQKNLDRLLSGL